MPSWDEYIISNLDDFSWLKYVILGFALVFVFAVIATAMVLTRKVDWYRIGASGPTLRARESAAD